MVKAISDWCYGKHDRYQRLAAENSASLVIRTIQLGGLRPANPD